jgi:MFS family permease
MIKAGLIGLVIGAIYVTSLTLLSPFCTLCLTPLLGLAVGYLAGWFDKPQTANASLRKGMIAGGITGLGAVAGQIVASIIGTILITNLEQLPTLIRELGVSEFLTTDTKEYWQATLTTNSFCGLLNLAIIVGAGGLGSIIWFQRQQPDFAPDRTTDPRI